MIGRLVKGAAVMIAALVMAVGCAGMPDNRSVPDHTTNGLTIGAVMFAVTFMGVAMSEYIERGEYWYEPTSER